jgi:glycerol-3-phosphate O-acyltransferase
VSRDRRGRVVDPVRYCYRDGIVVEDAARDAEYTRLLAAELAQAIRRQSVALPSSVLAYAAFRLLRARYPNLDVLRLLRVLGPHASLAASELRPELEAVLGSLRRQASEGAIRLAPELAQASVQRVLEQGARTLSRYHRQPVVTLDGELLRIHDPALLMYYRNRLAGFGLSGEREDPTAEVRVSRRPLP